MVPFSVQAVGFSQRGDGLLLSDKEMFALAYPVKAASERHEDSTDG